MKLRGDPPLSNVAFNLNLRRYSPDGRVRVLVEQVVYDPPAGAYTPPLFSLT